MAVVNILHSLLGCFLQQQKDGKAKAGNGL